MSSALALASITSVLKDLLDNRLIQREVTGSMGDVAVTALPPDRIPTGAEERSQLNFFLYRVTPHSVWRGSDRSLEDEHGEISSQPPLALDLHYLLTAYGEQDLQAEILLGYAMQLLHETPVLTRDAIRSALRSDSPNGSGSVLSPIREAFAASTWPNQIEQITVCPEFLSMEETSKLWASLQSRYRPSATYKVSTVLI